MKKMLLTASALSLAVAFGSAEATTFTTTSPTGGALPSSVSAVGGIVVDLVGTNGARVVGQVAAGTEYVGSAAASQYPLLFGTQSGFGPSVIAALGGGIASASFRISLYDGDSAPGNFDYNQNALLVNGLDFGNFSAVATQQTDGTGTTVYASGTGFGNNILATGFFSSTNASLLSSLYDTIVTTGSLAFRLDDLTPGDQYFDFTQGIASALMSVGSAPVVAAAVPEPATAALFGMGALTLLARRRRQVA